MPAATHLIYMTIGTLPEAEALATQLVEAHLVACVNILPATQSIYRWEGVVQRSTEVVLIAKTGSERVPELVGWVQDHHPYQCPCVVSVPIDGGNPDFLNWVDQETAAPSPSVA